MKKISAIIASLILSVAVLFSGCISLSGVDGKDGKDGKDASIYQIYEAVNEERVKAGLEELTFLEFAEQYLSYDGDALAEADSLQASINRSLKTGVSIASSFTVQTPVYNVFGQVTGTKTERETYFGAGVIIDIDKEAGNAYVVTNCHVIYNDAAVKPIAENVYLFLYGQDENYDVASCGITAKVIGASQSYDIALLKVEDSQILRDSAAEAAEFTTADDVYMGETVYAVGNPQGYGMSATQGIISKESETILIKLSSSQASQNVKKYRVIRTDAAINSGNSGGGLFDKTGKLVGIVNSKSSNTNVDNLGFALPASNVRRLVRLMLDNYNQNGFNGENGVSRAYLTAEYSAQPKLSKWNEETYRYEIYESVKITEAGDGLEADDAIRNIKVLNDNGEVVENKEVTRIYHVDDVLLSVRPNYTVVITVSRGGEQKDINIKTGSDYFVTVD